ncbi:hypothetical protein Sango_2004900 [Sesamum angolense]|uniref:Uncharacterized protein n=1 Tax=Sesamum angolense TaxID=2727404 RepID=A0AAE2BNT4_9LAMI|nr:hypothetical protein Sango_2004900 [Sesamum angolense]
MSRVEECVGGAWGSPFCRGVEMDLKLIKRVEYEYIEEDVRNNPLHKKLPHVLQSHRPVLVVVPACNVESMLEQREKGKEEAVKFLDSEIKGKK